MKATIRDTRIISNDATYHGWGTVARRRDGELLIACSGGREEHVDPFGKVYLLRSADGGDTWTGPDIIADGPLDDRDAGVLETSKGTLIVNWFTSLAWMNYLYRQETGEIDWLPKETQRRWRKERERIAEEVNVREELGVWAVRSEDGGKTWSDRINTVVNSPHGPIELSDGRLFYAGKGSSDFATWQRGSSHESGAMGAAQSTDDGRTWEPLGEIPYAEGHTYRDYHEAHAAEAEGGRLIVQIRNHGEPWKGETIQCESGDGGRTWTPPHSIGVWGTPSHLLKLADGRLLVTNGYRREPYGNQARVSGDGGRTWSEPVTVSGDGAGGDLGYPSSAQLDDGTIVSVWYEKLAGRPRAVLRQARWTLEG